MKAAVLALFILLTRPGDGAPLWMMASQIVAVQPPAIAGYCGRGANAQVHLSSGAFFCVTETPEQIMEKLQ